MSIIVTLGLNLNKKYHIFDQLSQIINYYQLIGNSIASKKRKPFQDSKAIEQKEVAHLTTAWIV